MLFDKNKFRKISLEISILLGLSFAIMTILLVLQFHTLLEQTFDDRVAEVEPTSLPEVEVRIEIAERSDVIGYELYRNSTDHQIELFELLIVAHDQFNETHSDIDLKNYANIIARNFVADFFTLSNKHSRSDVGGLQFVSEDLTEEFKRFAVDTFYLYLNQHIEAFGRDALPTVATTTILNSSFAPRWIEIENDEPETENDAYEAMLGTNLLQEQVPLKEEIRTIVIDIEWTFADSSLNYLADFQTSARLILLESEDGARIHAIELITESSENRDESQSSFIE